MYRETEKSRRATDAYKHAQAMAAAVASAAVGSTKNRSSEGHQTSVLSLGFSEGVSPSAIQSIGQTEWHFPSQNQPLDSTNSSIDTNIPSNTGALFASSELNPFLQSRRTSDSTTGQSPFERQLVGSLNKAEAYRENGLVKKVHLQKTDLPCH